MENPAYITTAELAKRFRLSTGTLCNWRVKGEGPPYIKLGKKVLYPLDGVVAYEQKLLSGGDQ